MPRIVASIEARMGSSRLPGKVLADIAGQPNLTRLLTRLRAATRLDGIVLATSTDSADDAVADWAAAQQLPCYRGSEDDVLNRVVEAHRMMESEIIVEITGDCPLTDPEIIDQGIDTFLHNDCDVVSNCYKLTYPMGADVQVFRWQDLEWVEQNIDDPPVREHVSLYFYENPDRYRIIHMRAPASCHGPDLRFQLDYPEDHDFIEAIYRRLEPVHGPVFGVSAIMDLLRREPVLTEINQHCEERSTR
jgi:spore coat polysaccharide biosynthesis protein SpsF